MVEFERSQYTVSESDGFANITVVKQRESTVPISVEFTTANDTARGIVYDEYQLNSCGHLQPLSGYYVFVILQLGRTIQQCQ